MVSLMGTLPAFTAECSTLSPCVINSVPALSSLSDGLASEDVQVDAPLVQSVTAPIAPTVDNVTDAVVAPVAETINKLTVPVVETVDNVVAPSRFHCKGTYRGDS